MQKTLQPDGCFAVSSVAINLVCGGLVSFGTFHNFSVFSFVCFVKKKLND